MPSLLALLSLCSLLFTLSLGSGLEKRQDLSGLPTCAQMCLGTALSTSGGGCSQTDFSCLCKSASFLKASESCYGTSCPVADVATATAWGVKTCASIGVNVAASSVANSTAGAANQTATFANNTASSLTPAAVNAKSASSAIAIPSLSVFVGLALGSIFA